MARPKPRKTDLSGLSPITQNPIKVTPSDEETTSVQPQKEKTEKPFTFTLPIELVRKTRAAFVIEGIPRGIKQHRHWIAEALERRIDEIEKTNGPLHGIDDGVLPKGWDTHY